jgi:hypothetical protein
VLRHDDPAHKSSPTGSCKTPLQVRIRVDIPELLPELCDYLLRRGWAAVEVGLDEANVHARWAPSDFEAAIMLLADVDLWRAQRPWTHVTVNPHVTG